MNYACYFSGNGTRFIKAVQNNERLAEHVRCVIYDDKNLDLKTFYEERGIKFYHFDYSALSREVDRNLELSDYILNILKLEQIDYCFCMGRHILKGKLLEEYRNRIINFHPSLLPKYKGLNAIDQAIENNEKVLGNTCHFIDVGVDTGPIILQNSVPVEAFFEGGYDAVLDKQLDLMYEVFELLENNKIRVDGNKVQLSIY